MNLARVVSVGILAIGLASCQHFEAERETTQPNILLIIADDLGFTDLSSYGSEIRTPNIDALAARGLRFSQFHTAPQCAPTRAMLYSGNNNHVAGALPDHREAFLSDQITPFPKRLQMLGYRTLIVGKWHLGHDAHQAPNHAGFDQSFVLTHGATHQFSTLGLTPRGTRYREDGRVVDYPTGEYTTTLFTNRIIDWIGSAKQPNKPFLAVASYTAPHWPLQVPEADLDLYQGVYDAGYDVLRQQRLDGAIAAGVAQPQTLPTRDPSVAAWDSLSPMQQRIESRKMELLAAMIEVLDRNIGRLIEHLRTADQLDNTLIIFLSDNGASSADHYEQKLAPYLLETFNNSLENMGKATSWVSIGPQWAEASTAPFSLYKKYTRQGGVVAPMIIAGPDVTHRGEVTAAFSTVMDVAPTILDYARFDLAIDQASAFPMLGESMRELLAGSASRIHADEYSVAMAHIGKAFFRYGDWKLVTLNAPFDESKFELYNLANDPGEQVDLRQAVPEQYARMVDLWRRESKRQGVQLP